MKKIFTLLFTFVAVMAMAQAPEGVFKKTTTKPVIDGVADAVWATANTYNVDQNFKGETPTLGAAGATTWKALWDNDGVYVLVTVADDEWYPGYLSNPASTNFWEYDQTEIYFDVNYNLADGKGAGGKAGHIQVAPEPKPEYINGTAKTETNGTVWTYKVAANGSYIWECFVPFTVLLDADNNQFPKDAVIGFDVCVIDREPADAARKRAVWSNTGTTNENYSNMDDAGHVTLEGAPTTKFVDDIKLAPGKITTDNGTLQVVATVLPATASNKVLKWSITSGAEFATISADGVLKALKDGTVTVKAVSTDGSMVEGEVDIEITGQLISQGEVWRSHNLFRNWNFEKDLAEWGGWIDAANMEGEADRKWEDGIAVMTPGIYTKGTEAWHYQFNQNNLKAQPNVAYVFRFKSWASADGTPAVVDFEDPSNSYGRFGVSTDADAVNGKSEWKYTINWEPQWYEYNVTFDQIKENTNQQVQFNFSLTKEKVWVDSVLLVTKELWDQYPSLPKDVTVGSKTLESSIKVYPNPVSNTLYVDLTSANAKVAVYNAIGQKLMEKTTTGKRVTFDVRSLQRGMYFVKLTDGTTMKFIK